MEDIIARVRQCVAQATADQIEKSLAVTMVRVTKDGLTYTAAKDAPSASADSVNRMR